MISIKQLVNYEICAKSYRHTAPPRRDDAAGLIIRKVKNEELKIPESHEGNSRTSLFILQHNVELLHLDSLDVVDAAVADDVEPTVLQLRFQY